MALKKLSKKTKWLIVIVAIASSMALVNASLFVYYENNQVTLNGQKPPITFSTGSNANGKDLWGNPITVNIPQPNITLQITVNPTYGKHLYKNITLILNRDTSQGYYLWFKVTTAFSSGVTAALLRIYDSSNNLLASIDLMSTALQPSGGPITISQASSSTTPTKLRIDLYLEISTSGGNYNNPPSISPSTAVLTLIYSPQNTETPPYPP